MRLVRLVHWHEGEVRERAALIRAAGFAVVSDVPSGRGFLESLRATAPHALVIDLSRLPAQGRDLALQVRYQKATSSIPVVFVGGADDKVQALRALLPDAAFTTWDRVGDALRSAQPLSDPVRPSSVFAAYSGRPLAGKLGIRAGFSVALVGAPPAFEDRLAPLPKGVEIHRDPEGSRQVTLWFVQTVEELANRIDGAADQWGAARLWIVWPKRLSGQGDLTQQHIRDAGLRAGLVDYKVCSVDDTWSALLFTRRRRAGVGTEAGEAS